MRKEIFGLLLVFMLIATTVSLFSYHPSDPCINVAADPDWPVHNQFGLIGAHAAGLAITLFGVGTFWIPAILVTAIFYLYKRKETTEILAAALGGIILMVTTGALLSLGQTHRVIFGKCFSSGGIIGISLANVMVRLLSYTGGFLFLIMLWTIGLMLTTRLSLVTCLRSGISILRIVGRWAKTTWEQKLLRHRDERTGAAPPMELNAPPSQKSASPKLIKKLLVKRPPEPGIDKTEKPSPQPAAFDVEAFMSTADGFTLPPADLLEDSSKDEKAMTADDVHAQSRTLEKKLEDFDISGHVVAVSPGPVVAMYEYEPAPGIKINRIVNLADDLALALKAMSIRIVAPIPGKAVIGIEVPNARREVVRLRDIITSKVFTESKSKLTLALGKDIFGNPVVADLAKMPHLLIAGATGSGKSVALNSMLCSILCNGTPDEIKLLLVDPKRIELSIYEGIPHLIAPVVTNAKKATQGLQWAVMEMERRYTLMAEKQVRDIYQYNKKMLKEAEDKDSDVTGQDAADLDEIQPNKHETFPLILIVIDELADLMLVASRDVEIALTRLAQMARAAGIHLLLATQRPSVDVLTGIIKANFPARISFQVSSRTDSRTILDTNGAERLLGNGDMLVMPGTSKLQRIHGAYVSETEIGRIIDFLKRQKQPTYKEEIFNVQPNGNDASSDEEYDEKYDEAVAIVTETRQASISMIQRRLRVGYNRAARMIELMERDGVVGPSDGVKAREVLVRGYEDLS